LSLRDSEPYDPECGNCGHPFSFHYDEEEKVDEHACDYCNRLRIQCGCQTFGDFAFEPEPIMPWD